MVEMSKVGTNLIAEDFEHGVGFDIEYNNIIHEECTIGDNATIRSNVELRSETKIGDDAYVDSGVKSSGENIIGDDVTLRYSSIIARGCEIGDEVYICPQVMTNNVDQHGDEIGGATVGKGSFIGTQTVLGAGVEIPPGTVIGSNSMVPHDIEEKGVYVGTPVKKIKDL